MSTPSRPYGGVVLLGRAGEAPAAGEAATATATATTVEPAPAAEPARVLATEELKRGLAAVRGQAHLLLYLADQLDDALVQLEEAPDAAHRAFLSKIFAMYSGQLEARHHGLGDRITEVGQEVYLLVRDLEAR